MHRFSRTLDKKRRIAIGLKSEGDDGTYMWFSSIELESDPHQGRNGKSYQIVAYQWQSVEHYALRYALGMRREMWICNYNIIQAGFLEFESCLRRGGDYDNWHSRKMLIALLRRKSIQSLARALKGVLAYAILSKYYCFGDLQADYSG